MIKKIIILVSLNALLLSCSTNHTQSEARTPASIDDLPGKTKFERSGCCSHHNGVCGCDQSSDKITCCDGTTSPSCTCSGY